MGLGAEAIHFLGAGPRAGEDHLQGDDAIEAFLPRLVDHTHAAAADCFEQLVIAELLAGRRQARCGPRGGAAPDRSFTLEE